MAGILAAGSAPMLQGEAPYLVVDCRFFDDTDDRIYLPGGVTYVNEQPRVGFVKIHGPIECRNCGAPVSSHEPQCTYCLTEP